MIKYLFLTFILISMPVQSAHQGSDSELKIYFASKSDNEFSISSITIDNPEDIQTLTSIPTTFSSTIADLFTEREIEFMQSYAQEAPNHGLNIPESSMDLDRDRQFSTTIEGMLAAPDNEKVAITTKHTFCLLDFYLESCFGVYEILTVDTIGAIVPVLKIGIHETDDPFLRDCLGIPRFHSIEPKLVDWTADSNSLIVTTEGLGYCFAAGHAQPFVLVDVTEQLSPFVLEVGNQIALQQNDDRMAILKSECSVSCMATVSTVEYKNGQVSSFSQVSIPDFLSQNIFWLSEYRVVLFGLELRPLEQQFPVAIILNIDSGDTEYHELEAPLRHAKMTESQNKIVIQQYPNELALLDVDAPSEMVPFYGGDFQDWKTGPDDLILIQPTEGEEWHIIDMEGETISEFTLISDGNEIISVDW